MKLIIQRTTEACVSVEGVAVGKIGKGFLVLVGITHEDNRQIVEKMVQKMINLRIFEDEQGKTNLSLKDVNGSILLVSQFTLYADCKKGNRPAFIRAAAPQQAEELYQYVIELCQNTGFETACGVFGADMKVSLINDGPFTIVLDSDEICL